MRVFDSQALRVGFAALIIFTLMAGDFWRNLTSWYGWGALIVLLLLGAVTALVVARVRLTKLPMPLLVFIALATASIAWSAYPGATALGAAATWATTVGAVFLALLLTWAELLTALGIAVKWILGLSLAFELFVTVVIRHPVLPFFTDYGDTKLPRAFYWSRDLLGDLGRIQGIQGNSNLLAMTALIAIIVFGIQLAQGNTRRATTIAWLFLSVGMLAITRSSTVLVAAVLTAAVLGVILAVRATTGRARVAVYSYTVIIGAAGLTAVLLFQSQLLSILGRSDDLTGRIGIWDAVIQLAAQRPVAGWGWVSYWVPWASPFDHLAVIKGVTYLQAHEAWLDVWFQLGVIGVVIFAALVVTTFGRSWLMAIDRAGVQPGSAGSYSTLALLPILILTALLVQSLAESRLLLESGWLLLATFAIKTKLNARSAEPVK